MVHKNVTKIMIFLFFTLHRLHEKYKYTQHTLKFLGSAKIYRTFLRAEF